MRNEQIIFGRGTLVLVIPYNLGLVIVSDSRITFEHLKKRVSIYDGYIKTGIVEGSPNRAYAITGNAHPYPNTNKYSSAKEIIIYEKSLLNVDEIIQSELSKKVGNTFNETSLSVIDQIRQERDKCLTQFVLPHPFQIVLMEYNPNTHSGKIALARFASEIHNSRRTIVFDDLFVNIPQNSPGHIFIYGDTDLYENCEKQTQFAPMARMIKSIEALNITQISKSKATRTGIRLLEHVIKHTNTKGKISSIGGSPRTLILT